MPRAKLCILCLPDKRCGPEVPGPQPAQARVRQGALPRRGLPPGRHAPAARGPGHGGGPRDRVQAHAWGAAHAAPPPLRDRGGEDRGLGRVRGLALARPPAGRRRQAQGRARRPPPRKKVPRGIPTSMLRPAETDQEREGALLGPSGTLVVWRSDGPDDFLLK